MKKNTVLKLFMDTVDLVPDLQFRKEFISNSIIDSRHSLLAGSKALIYYYSELRKAVNGENSIFSISGHSVVENNQIIHRENGSVLFQMSLQDFSDLNLVLVNLNQTSRLLREDPLQPLNSYEFINCNDCEPIEFLNLMAPEIRQELMVSPIIGWEFEKVTDFFVSLIRELCHLRLYQLATYRKLISALDNLGCIQPFIENWLLRAFNTDETFAFAYNFIAQSESIRTCVPFPQKEVSILELTRKIQDENSNQSNFLNHLPETGSGSVIQRMIKTNCEFEFFRIIEKLTSSKEGCGQASSVRKKQLVFLTDELKAEIIENITLLSADDRNFYLKRLLKRTSDIPVSAYVNDKASSDFIPMESFIEPGEKSLLIEPVVKNTRFNLVNHFKNELLNFILNQMDIEQSVEEILPALKSSKVTPIVSGTSEITGISLNEMNNNFDSTPIHKVYDFFERELVAKKLLSENQMIAYLYFAFYKKEQPPERFHFSKNPPKSRIIKIFYNYFSEIALKPFSKQKKYAALLGDYFEGFDTANVSSNFSK